MWIVRLHVLESVKVQNSTDGKRKFRVGFLILQIGVNLHKLQNLSDNRCVKLLKYKKPGRLQVGKWLKVFIECQITSGENM